MSGLAIVIVVALAMLPIAGFAWWKLRNARNFRSLPPQVQQQSAQAKAARKAYVDATRMHQLRVKKAQDDLALLENPTGRVLQTLGGVTLTERWITTPQGSGSIIGVKAQAADETAVRQRLTATRMVTLGVFALAAPKKRATGSAYVVIEGPQVSGVATIIADKGGNAGPAAYAFAAAINNVARAAEVAEQTRHADIERARTAVASAGDRSEVDQAAFNYAQSVASLPPAFRSKYSDAPRPTPPRSVRSLV